ncbi:DUF3450 domain-containing protein [Marinicauda algicola]|uniref:DUF3450 domain-containing protein n=1 Tax=Marinicauda algicola TaxID=2029849 RepID=A0A4S2H0A5_9PROT|nr:DUF3450 domain-containing protein [Marinicauda algicola]TGY88512.1 DUF3450 domain-containing protein [Marinicauda algicola]
MSNTMKWIRTSLLAGVAAAAGSAAFAQSPLDQALQVARSSTQQGAQAQEQIDEVADQADDLERQYLALRQQIEDQEVFVQQQEVFLQSQQVEISELQRQLERVDTLEAEVTPMLLEMTVALEDFIAQDLPFQMQLRQSRLDNIRNLLGDATVSVAETYRVILNAYEIESSYGRSLRVYSDVVELDGVPQDVKFLQLGRVALIRVFQSGDRAGEMEIMTKDNQEWRALPGSFAQNVQRAIRIGEEVTTPEVFIAPLPGPERAQ